MRIERRILLGRMETGTGGWDDPANKAYYEELRRQQRELDAKLVQFAKKMQEDEAPERLPPQTQSGPEP